MKKLLAMPLSVLMILGCMTCLFIVPASAEGENLWTNWNELDEGGNPKIFGDAGAPTASISGETLFVDNAWYSSYWLNLPEVEKNTFYKLSFSFNNNKADPPSGNVADAKINTVTLQNFDGTVKIGTMASNIALNTTSQVVSEADRYINYEFYSGDNTQFRIHFNMDYVYRIWFKRFSLTQVPTNDIIVENGSADLDSAKEGETVTLTADSVAGKVFDGWKVVSGNATLDDAAASTTTFTMTDQPVTIRANYKTDLWKVTVDSFVKKVPTVENGVYTIPSPWYADFSIVIPALEEGKTYRLSFVHQIRLSPLWENDADGDGKPDHSDKNISQLKIGSNIVWSNYQTDNTWTKFSYDFVGTGAATTLYINNAYTDILNLKDLTIVDLSETETTGKLTTAYNSLAAIRAASDAEGSITKNGMRLYNEVKKTWITDYDLVEYGSMAVRKEYMQNHETLGQFDAPCLEMLGVKGVGVGPAYREAGVTTVTGSGAVNSLWDETDDAMVFTSYLTGIAQANYDSNYVVVTYAIDRFGNVYYGDTWEISVFDVAYAIDKKYTESPNDVSSVDINAFNSFVGPEKESYLTWCGENSTGNLFAALEN